MSFMDRLCAPQRIDTDAIRREYSLPSVVAGTGIKLLPAGREFKACCPFHADRSPSFTIFSGGARFHCFGCGASGDVLDFVRRTNGVGLRQAADLLTGGNVPSIHVAVPPLDGNEADRVAEALEVWRLAVPAAGTLAETYLRSRRLTLPIPDSIRFASLRYGKRGPEYPCLVAAVASADDRLTGIQRTYLKTDGSGKLAVAKPKLSLGRVSGGAIRLAPCAASLVVCEGLEDGLTLQQELGRAVWVAAGASMLPAMRFPAGVRSVAIGGDADEPGRVSARNAGQSFAARGIRSRVFFPIEAKDFNAELMEGVTT